MLSVQQIIKAIEQLLTIHTSLLEISKRKTEIIKTGAIGDLQPLLMKEQRHIQALKQAENSREQTVRNWESNQVEPMEATTISVILEHVTEHENREHLTEITTELTNMITAVKQQETLNRSLIEQSLRFVDMSLDLLQPSINQFNYGKRNRPDRGKQQSVFDSKA